MHADTTKRPSFASVLHRLSLGDGVSGAEIRALPGFSGVETAMPLFDCLEYGLIDCPELIEHAGKLAEPEIPGVTLLARLLGDAIRHDEEQQGYLDPLPEHMRFKMFELGAAADRCVQLN